MQKNRNSCGLDNLPMELWRFGGNELKIHLLEVFNKIIDKNQMPQEWETGMLINIHKNGTKSKSENLLHTLWHICTCCMPCGISVLRSPSRLDFNPWLTSHAPALLIDCTLTLYRTVVVLGPSLAA